VNIPPLIKPGQIMIRDENGQWRAIWPHNNYMSHADRWFLGIVSMLSLTLLSISAAMLWMYE